MVYRNRPITKFCCSDLPETEIRIIANVSIITTFLCLFLLFLSYANLQEIDEKLSIEAFLLMNNNCSIETKEGICENNTAATTEVSNLGTTETIPTKSTKKPESISTLDWLCNLFLWERNAETFWILLPFLWNISDMLRGLLLYHAIRNKITPLLKLWHILTSANTLAGIIIFYPIFIKYKTGDLQAAFIVMFIFILFYNFYSLWIVKVFLKELRNLTSSGTISTLTGGTTFSSNNEVEMNVGAVQIQRF